MPTNISSVERSAKNQKPGEEQDMNHAGHHVARVTPLEQPDLDQLDEARRNIGQNILHGHVGLGQNHGFQAHHDNVDEKGDADDRYQSVDDPGGYE